MHVKFLMMLLTLSLLTAGGCAEPVVRTDFDPSTEFSAFRTYTFTRLTDTDQGGVLENSLLRKRIEEMVRQQMTAKGLRQVNLEEHPDLLAHFWVAVQEKENIESTGPRMGRYGGGYGRVSTYRYEEGTLIIDLLTPPQKDLVWRGTIVGTLSDTKEENMQILNKAIVKAFEDYPPKSKTQ